jgi:hypothetical protein
MFLSRSSSSFRITHLEKNLKKSDYLGLFLHWYYFISLFQLLILFYHY